MRNKEESEERKSDIIKENITDGGNIKKSYINQQKGTKDHKNIDENLGKKDETVGKANLSTKILEEIIQESKNNSNILEISPESALHSVKKLHSNKLEGLPPNVIGDTEMQPFNKKKGKNKPIPKTIERVLPNCTDVGVWRKRNRLTHKTKIFKMFGNYTTIKKTLYEKGWVENKDKNSPCFDLLWTLKQRDIDYDTLKEGQIVNHFRYNGVITTKLGLCRNIGKVINFNNIEVDTFFPK